MSALASSNGSFATPRVSMRFVHWIHVAPPRSDTLSTEPGHHHADDRRIHSRRCARTACRSTTDGRTDGHADPPRGTRSRQSARARRDLDLRPSAGGRVSRRGGRACADLPDRADRAGRPVHGRRACRADCGRDRRRGSCGRRAGRRHCDARVGLSIGNRRRLLGQPRRRAPAPGTRTRRHAMRASAARTTARRPCPAGRPGSRCT